MSQENTPDWIKNLHLPPQRGKEYPPEIDNEILNVLQKLSFEQLNHLADISGVRNYLGVLLPPNEWSREQYIEILSDISEMTEGQVRKIRTYIKDLPESNKRS